MKENRLEYELLDLYNILEEIKKYNHVFIYGAGMVGTALYGYLKKKGAERQVECFLESNIKTPIIETSSGVQIKNIHDLIIEADDVVLLAAKRRIRDELKVECKRLNVKNTIEINCFDDRDFIYYSSIPEEVYPLEMKAWYESITGKKLNIDNPKTFNEKINWMKLNDRDNKRTALADKFLVREYVKNTVGEKYLINLLGAWDKPEKIDFNNLPNKFVLKCNHGCGWNIIVTDKNKVNYDTICSKLNEWLSINYAFVYGFEMQYKDIKPMIIAEEYLENTENDLFDYKFWCFGGKVKFIMFLSNRKNELLMDNYDLDWKLLPFTYDFPNSKLGVEKPDNLKEMIHVAELLASDIPFVRIDLYRLNDGKIKFGEMTFTPASGTCLWSDEKVNIELGKLIDLTECKYIK